MTTESANETSWCDAPALMTGTLPIGRRSIKTCVGYKRVLPVATREKRWNKVNAWQHLLTHSPLRQTSCRATGFGQAAKAFIHLAIVFERTIIDFAALVQCAASSLWSHTTNPSARRETVISSSRWRCQTSPERGRVSICRPSLRGSKKAVINQPKLIGVGIDINARHNPVFICPLFLANGGLHV